MAEPHPDVVDPHHPLTEQVRAMCLSYPDAIEVRAWGRPTFRSPNKIFVVMGAMMTRPYSVIVKPDPVDAPALQQDPRIFAPPYWGPFGWLAIDVDARDTDWREIAELIDASYRLVALKRQLRRLDAAPIVR